MKTKFLYATVAATLTASAAAAYEAWRRMKIGPGAWAKNGDKVVVSSAKLMPVLPAELPAANLVVQVSAGTTGAPLAFFNPLLGDAALHGVILGIEAPTTQGYAPMGTFEVIGVDFRRDDVLKILPKTAA